MKFFKFIFVFAIMLFLVIKLSIEHKHYPPIGKFLSPFSGFWHNVDTASISAPKTLNLKQLKEEVIIKYDKHLIPHVFANNDDDIAFATGYLHAMHRLWQMDMICRSAVGRLSEVVGEKAIEHDRKQRRLGMLYAAEKSLELWMENKEVKRLLENYANGVNAYINSLTYKNYPIEYKLLSFEPENWTPLKSVIIQQYMNQELTLSENDLENTNALNLFKDDFDFLFPEYLPTTTPIISNRNSFDLIRKINLKKKRKLKTNRNITSTIINENANFDRNIDNNVSGKSNIGSNNWAVAGTKTNSGYPILANDMHLTLRLPSIWYHIQQVTPDNNLFGYTIPGIPMVVVGFNDSIAWGFTNSCRDLADWYKIEFSGNSKEEYKYDDKVLKTQQRIEEIKIKGNATIYDTVVYTHYGPVVYDDKFPLDKDRLHLALKWTAHEPSLSPLAFVKMGKSKNYQEFKEAIFYYATPPQNIAFASSKGEIAMHIQGKFPIKENQQGRFILDGSTSENEWGDFVPFEENPYVLNPKEGFVASANQYPIFNYPYYIHNNNQEHYRNRYINRILEKSKNITPMKMMDLQNDNYSLKAEEVLPIMLKHLEINMLAQKEREIFYLLSEWEYSYDASKMAPTFFEIWWQELYRSIWDEFLNKGVKLNLPSESTTIHMLTHFPNNKYIDIVRTPQQENLTDLVNMAYRAMLNEVEKIKDDDVIQNLEWRNHKKTNINHLADIEVFSRKDLDVGGSPDAVNAITSSVGPSQRLIVSLSKDIKAWSILPGGQSGNPGNKHYDDMIEMWEAGQYIPLLFLKKADDEPEDIIFTQTLNPTKE